MNKNYIYPATLLCDFYKVNHREQYPQGTKKFIQPGHQELVE